MNDLQPTDQELLAYLDEMLSSERSAQIEIELRQRNDLQHRAALLLRRRDSGGHTIGEIWRRRHLSCLNRETLGAFVLGVCAPDVEDYVIFHTRVVGCRICLANLQDLHDERTSSDNQQARQKRYFESSAGLLRSQRQE